MSAITTAWLKVRLTDLQTAYEKLSTGAVTSYSLGDANYTLKDTAALLKEISEIDTMITRRTTRTANRLDFRNVR